MSTERDAGIQDMLRMMTSYMAWANKVMLDSAAKTSEFELTRPRQTLFGNIVHTFNHILVVQDIFRAHLEGRRHHYTARNTDVPPPFDVVRERLPEMDQYYVELAGRLSAEELGETIHFEFVGGGEGAMTRLEILLHLVNHATYHRGFISDLLYQVSHKCDANDLSVFLRDAWPRQQH
jgi:uncharacterized damage-inducible protein DinB